MIQKKRCAGDRRINKSTNKDGVPVGRLKSGITVWLEASHLKNNLITPEISPSRQGHSKVIQVISNRAYQLALPCHGEFLKSSNASLLLITKRTGRSRPTSNDHRRALGSKTWRKYEVEGHRQS